MPSSSTLDARPRVGVVLAAGRATRLAEVTGGSSKLLLRVGGMTLVERAVRMLLAGGLDRVVVVVGHQGDEVATQAGRASTRPGAVEIVRAPRWEEGNGESLAAAAQAVEGEPLFVVLCGDIVFPGGALTGLLHAPEPAVLVDPSPSPEVWAEGTRVHLDETGRAVDLGRDLPDPAIDGGAFVFDRGIFGFQQDAARAGDHTLTGAFRRLARAKGMAVVPIPPGTAWQDIDTPDDLKAARRILRRSLIKTTDAPIFRYLYRPISTRVTLAIAPLRPSPNLITGLAFGFGMAAAFALSVGEGLAAGLLIQANTILDGVDGEIARLHFKASPGGAVIDAVIDRIVDGSLVAGVGLWLWPFHPSSDFRLTILVMAAYGWGFVAYHFRDKIAQFEVTEERERALVLLLGGRDSRLFILSAGAMLGQPGAAVVVGWSIFFSSVLRRLYLMRRRRRSAGPAPARVAAPDHVRDGPGGDLQEER
jgi:1L-myo-inositol 1-phosphate cytidylyltransferase / CDP-L-myo-inositol myo-inositolphosphotransferase